MRKVRDIIKGYSNQNDDANGFNEAKLPAKNIYHRNHLYYDATNAEDWHASDNDVVSSGKNHDECETQTNKNTLKSISYQVSTEVKPGPGHFTFASDTEAAVNAFSFTVIIDSGDNVTDSLLES